MLALDQSKAYDRVPLDLLEELLNDSGIHPAISRPMLCMARSSRRIKVLDVIGSSKIPWCGLVPGCPMATIVEGLLMLRWRVMVVQGIPRSPTMVNHALVVVPPAVRPQHRKRVPLILRCWVDDSTAGDLGTEESVTTIVKGLRAIELLAASDRLVVNRTKSAIAAAPAEFRTALAALIQGGASWDQGGVLVLCEEAVEQNLLDYIAERLGVDVAKVHVGGFSCTGLRPEKPPCWRIYPEPAYQRSRSAPSLLEEVLCSGDGRTPGRTKTG